MKNTITKILGHDVSWYAESKSVKELDDSSIEHIEKCIKDDISQGELNVCYGKNMERESSGWWHIINWRDIACQLRNSIVAVKVKTGEVNIDAQKESVKRFDKEWVF